MITEKAQKYINELVECIKDYGMELYSLDIAIEQLIYDCYDCSLFEENEDLKESLSYEIFLSITTDKRIQCFEADIYAYDGKIKNLYESYFCDTKYDNPFEAMKDYRIKLVGCE